MLAIGSILVDFDGTACTKDVSEVLLERFGDPAWSQYDDLVDRGEIGLREAARIQTSMLKGSRQEMLAVAIAECPLDPTFGPFVAWAGSNGLPLAIASDGFAFYVGPILEAGGVERIQVITNELDFDGDEPKLRHPNANPDCVGCGTCKMLAALDFRDRFGSVAFVGEGQSDRYGALYSDVVFAKDALTEICARDGVPFLPWRDFDDVRTSLERLATLPGAVDPARCPGWIPAAEPR
jgi:2,3-diketo-5-methylthio-1-phosphopentane phosphatase